MLNVILSAQVPQIDVASVESAFLFCLTRASSSLGDQIFIDDCITRPQKKV